MPLQEYQRKRNFRQTSEPRGKVERTGRHRFMVQEHHASRLHFDFRLELGGVLKSWAVPKGPSMDPRDKRLAVQVEDHPVSYFGFEGTIDQGNYGAGEVRVWDSGTYELVEPFDPLEQLDSGKLSFVLKGKKLKGEFTLVHLANRDQQWLLMKKADADAVKGWTLDTILNDDASNGKTPRQRAARSTSRPRASGNGTAKRAAAAESTAEKKTRRSGRTGTSRRMTGTTARRKQPTR